MENQKVDESFALFHLKRFIKEYQNLDVKNVKIQRMTGITNMTFRFSHTQENIEPKDVIFRVFGKTCEGTFIDRNDETQVYLEVAKHGLGPSLYGYDDLVRAEKFLYSQVLPSQQMNTKLYRRQVAETLSRFHQIKIGNIHAEPLFEQVFNKSDIIPAVLAKINKRELFTEEENKIIDEIKKVWFNEEEKKTIVQHLEKHKDQIVFSHNDLLANNILILDEDKSIQFIDFEYCHYNLRTYDISNYFCESRYDYSNPKTPFFFVDNSEIKSSDLEDCARTYLLCQELNKKSIKYDVHKLNDDDYYNSLLQQVDQQYVNGQCQQMVYKEMPLTECLAHFYWGIWSLYMSKNPDIDFDYISFAQERFSKYLEAKQRL